MKEKIEYKTAEIKTSHVITICAIIFAIILAITIIVAGISNSYATSADTYIEYEQNDNALNIQQIVAQNSNINKIKEQTVEERDVEYEVQFVENPTLPKGEEKITQPGVLGKDKVTTIKTYEGDELVDEVVLSAERISDPSAEIVDIGTSDFLANNKVHIGDTMYLTKTVVLKKAADTNSKDVTIKVVEKVKTTVSKNSTDTNTTNTTNSTSSSDENTSNSTITESNNNATTNSTETEEVITEKVTEKVAEVNNYLDVTLIELVNEEWCKVSFDGTEGYVQTANLTSSAVTPSVLEKNRIQRIILNVNEDMEINKSSGLKLEDFKTIFSDLASDTNNVFKENYEAFYNADKNYNINGIFLAAMAIHESGWGTSQIANDKKNLFGYGSYDRSPYASSYEFEDYKEGIELVAKVLVKYYLNPKGTKIYDNETALATYYNGPTISDVNKKYASDKNWHTKVFNYMEYLYNRLK